MHAYRKDFSMSTTKELQKQIEEKNQRIAELESQVNEVASQSLAIEVTLRRELDGYRQAENRELSARVEHYQSMQAAAGEGEGEVPEHFESEADEEPESGEEA